MPGSRRARTLGRREFLRTLAFSAGIPLAGRMLPVFGAPAVETIPDVSERLSSGGVLDTTMDLAFSSTSIDGNSLFTRTFDGMIPGPTLRLRPGDLLRIRFNNNFPPNSDVIVDMNIPHHFNTFTFHTHGLHVSPSGNSDNVFVKVEPGDSYQLEIQIPSDHPGGTFWYHPHKHGAVRAQIMSGMMGALVIEGEVDQIPEIAAARSRLLVIQEIRVNSSTGAISEVGDGTPEDLVLWLLNGARMPTIVLQPGEVQRFRFVYAGLADTRSLSLDNHTWYQIAQDGITLTNPIMISSVFLSPGNRVDVLVRGGSPGTHTLRLGGIILANVVVEGPPVTMAFPSSLPGEPRYPTIESQEITGTRTIKFDESGGLFVIDGKLFDERLIDYSIRLGSVEEWTIVNTTNVPHPFHIHTNPFEVFEVGGASLSQKIWMDVVNVPANSSVKFRTRFEDFTGKFVLHCHILGHEDRGMMKTVMVYDPTWLPPILEILLNS